MANMRTDERGQATFIGIGAQKTASTWLYGVLGQLPGVSVSEPKELDFFSAHFDRGYEWYERHFPGTEATHRGEVSPSYFADSDAPARAAAYNGALRIFVTLRDPVDRAFSNHLHEVQRDHVSGANRIFETALDNNPFYIEQGRYARHLSRWLDHFPREAVLVLFQERIRDHGVAMAGRVAATLNIETDGPLVDRRANESVAYKNKLVGETFWRVGRLARRSGLGGTVEHIKRAPGVRQLREVNRRDVRDEVPAMREETRERLTDLYRAEVNRLAEMLGEVPPWPRFQIQPAREVVS